MVNRSSMEKILFHTRSEDHGGTIFLPVWNDLVLASKDINPFKD